MARYDLKKVVDRENYKSRCQHLLSMKEPPVVDLIKKRDYISPPQNRYLHLLIRHFAMEYGDTFEYVKQDIFKRVVNPEIFKTEYTNKKNGLVRTRWRSTSDLDSAEMTKAIERFRNWSSNEAGIYLPTANEEDFLRHIFVESERNYGHVG